MLQHGDLWLAVMNQVITKFTRINAIPMQGRLVHQVDIIDYLSMHSYKQCVYAQRKCLLSAKFQNYKI